MAFAATLLFAQAHAAGLSAVLPPQALADALDVFAKATGYQLIYRAELSKGLTSGKADPGLPAVDTLRQILRDTGLDFDFVNSRTIAIIKAGESSDRSSAATAPPGSTARVPDDSGAPASVPHGNHSREQKMSNRGFLVRMATYLGLCVAGATTGPACAQSADTAGAEALEQVIVTGSRLISDGSQAPTPVTVVAPDFLENAVPTDLIRGLNTLPQFDNSENANERQHVQGAQSRLGNFLNLRGLGPGRTLILMDGNRVPATTIDGSVDSNTLPQMLIQRVDIVTGGASAAYGSDAVSGVVNYVLDRNFVGLKGVAQGGISEEGDAETYRVGAAFGTSLGGDRLHVLATAELQNSQGIEDNEAREPGARVYLFTGNGSAANPWQLTPNARFARMSFGGLVTSGPFNNQQFLPGGSLGPYDSGRPTGLNGVIEGGDGGYLRNIWATADLRSWRTFARASYELTSSTDAWIQATFANSVTYAGNLAPDIRNNFTIFSGNAFLTPAQQAALGSTASFTVARVNDEFGPTEITGDSDVWSVVAGLNGAIFGGWSWKATVAHGVGKADYVVNQANNYRLFAALDAVRDASGQVVCNVSITNPGLYPGCVPLNVFGVGAPSQAAIDYIRGVPSLSASKNTSTDVSASIQGQPFSTWAGPVGLAFGAEHRKFSLDVTSNSNPVTQAPFTGIRGVPAGTASFYTANTGWTDGSEHVTEAFLETSVPLAEGRPGLYMFAVDLAGRATDYSTSGRVNTWKAGVSWKPFNDDFRIRATQSRDIRAPDLTSLFSGQTAGRSIQTDPHTGLSQFLNTVGGGNPTLQPERADTRVIGFVYTPSQLPSFTLSADFYSINIDDAITTISAVEILNICERSGGTAPECALVTRPLPFSDTSLANFPTSVRVSPINASVFEREGVDLEVGWSRDLLGGSFRTRLLGSRILTFKSQNSVASPLLQLAGQSGALDTSGNQFAYPKHRASLQASYSRQWYTVTLSEQYIGSMKQSNYQVVAPGLNDIAATWYTGLTVKFNLMQGALEPFIAVTDLFNTTHPIIPANAARPGGEYPTAQLLYDMTGRYITAGVHFRF